jgi:uncharacterized membrane protein YraQ (UPF0718 family)
MEAFNMTWEVLWPLILGFALSGAVQAVVSRKSMVRLLGDDSPRSLVFATLFGIASSSCSYAAVALARSLFVKGASFTAAMVFELASTNLVIELGIILVVLMGWQFAATFYATMATAGYVVEVLFAALGIIPTQRDIAVFTTGPSLNYTTVLSVLFLLLAAALVVQFLRTGGPAMLRMMNASPKGGRV